jgi:septal ring-binding cell division protein DamX
LISFGACVVVSLLPQSREWASTQSTQRAVAALSATATNTATITPTPSATGTATDTPTVTATPSNEERARGIIDGVVIGDVLRVSVISVPGDSRLVAAYEMAEDLDGYAVGYSGSEMAQAMCALRANGFEGYTIQLSAMIDLVDGFGNPFSDEGLTVNVSPGTLARFNCANADSVNLEAVADSYSLHRLLRGD